MEAGAHVFAEEPLALSVEDAELVVETVLRTGRKMVMGYI
jgi:predicted dehydrogenase